jgi:N-formylglutamate deformylase
MFYGAAFAHDILGKSMADIIPYILHEADLSDDPADVSPVVFDNPHSCTFLPADFMYDCPQADLKEFGDLHIEKMLRDVPALGIPVLEARVSRAYIDLNRDADEIDPAEVKGGWDKHYNLSPYTKGGHGLIASKLGRPQGLARIFNKSSRPTQADIEHRIQNYHRPYYQALFELLNKAHAANGLAMHVDVHSYGRPADANMADIIIGDYCGASCDPLLGTLVERYFADQGLSVAFNDPFQGASLIEKTSQPENGFHSIQIEIARDLYMIKGTNDYCVEKGEAMKKLLTGLAVHVNSLARYMAMCRPAPTLPNTSLKL